jgi:hypothetical protein
MSPENKRKQRRWRAVKKWEGTIEFFEQWADNRASSRAVWTNLVCDNKRSYSGPVLGMFEEQFVGTADCSSSWTHNVVDRTSTEGDSRGGARTILHRGVGSNHETKEGISASLSILSTGYFAAYYGPLAAEALSVSDEFSLHFSLSPPPACGPLKLVPTSEIAMRNYSPFVPKYCLTSGGPGFIHQIPLPEPPEDKDEWRISGVISDTKKGPEAILADPRMGLFADKAGRSVWTSAVKYDLVATPGDIREITVWLNAFIPKNVPKVTKTVPGTGTHSGKTMVPSTFWGDCFLTDQRTYDSSRDAKHRMQSLATFDLPHEKMTQKHSCDLTTEVDCGTGEEEETGTGKTNRMKWKEFKVSEDGLTYTARLEAAGSVPLVAAARVIGDIDYEGDLRIELNEDGESAVVSFDGKVDTFPAFEMYVSADNGPPLKLFTKSPKPEATALGLGGFANRPVSGKETVHAKQ